MTGYLQRLVARRVAVPAAQPAVRPTIRSASPVADVDQRMNAELSADPMSMPPDQAGAVAESRTIPSYKLAPPAAATPRQPAPTAPPPIHRFVAPQAAVPAALPPPAAAPSPAARPPAVTERRDVTPPHDAPDRSPPPLSHSNVAAPLPAPLPSRPAMPASAASEPGPGDIRPPAPQPHDARPPVSVTAVTQVLQQVEASPEPHSVPAGTAMEPVPRLPPPMLRAPLASDLDSAPRRIEREIELNGTAPVHAPGPPPRHVLVREVVRVAPAPAPPAPPPPSRGPRTAEEASVIGPLARPDRVRTRLELWLR